MIKISRHLAFSSALFAALMWGSIACAYDLAESFRSGELWTIKRERNPAEGLFIRDADETSSYATASGTNNMKFDSLLVGEVLLDWKEPQEEPEADEEAPEQKKPEDKAMKAEAPQANVLYRVTALVYTRGDDDEMGLKEFKNKVKELTDQLTGILGKRGKKGMLPSSKAGMKINTILWTNEHGALRMESATSSTKKSGKKAELIRLVMAPNVQELDRGGASDKVKKRDLKANVETDEDGTIWIKDIPMIDQGDKGYCLPATVARVFAYYGMDGVGMHEVAALCGSSAEDGTSIFAMKKTLKDIGGRFHVRFKEHPRPSTEFFDCVSAYNAEARKNKKPELADPNTAMGGNTNWRAGMDPELWCKVRSKKASDVKKWMAPIRKSITAGVPVLWSVFDSSLYTGINASGGAHMRMIIGFNPKNNTIVFSDSWGKGAAKRVMTMNEAYAVTDSTYTLEP